MKQTFKITSIFLCALILCLPSVGQELNVPPLYKEYQRLIVDMGNLYNLKEYDNCIAKADSALDLYGLIRTKEPSIAEEYVTYVPYTFMARSYEDLEKIDSATIIYEKVCMIGKKYSSVLIQNGIEPMSLLNNWIAYRNYLYQRDSISQVIDCTHDILFFCQKYCPVLLYEELYKEGILHSKIAKDKDALQFYLAAFEALKKYGNESNTPSLAALREIVYHYKKESKYKEAIAFVDSNRVFIDSIAPNDQESLLQTNFHLFSCYMKSGKYERAINASKLIEAYTLQQYGGDSPEYATALGNKAMMFLDLFKITEREQYLEYSDSIMALTKSVWDNIETRFSSLAYCTFLNNYALMLGKKMAYQEEEHILTEVLNLYNKNMASDNDIVNSLSNLAVCYENQGKILKADSVFRKAELICSHSSAIGHPLKANLYRLLSQHYNYEMNNLRLAEEYAIKAYDIDKNNLQSLSMIESLENLAKLYRNMGHYGKSIDLRYEALDIRQKMKLVISSKEILEMGEDYMYAYNQLPEELFPSIEKMAEKSSEGLQARSNALLGLYYMHKKQYGKAESYLLKNNELRRDEEESLNLLSYFYTTKGDYTKGLDYALKAYNINQDQTNSQNVIFSALLLGDKQTAREYFSSFFEKVVEDIETYFSFMSEQQREALIYSDKIPIAACPTIAHHLQEDSLSASIAYNAALIYKGLLLNTARNLSSVIQQKGDSVLLSDYISLMKIRKDDDNNPKEALKKEIEYMEKSILRRVAKENPLWGNFHTGWKDVQKNLKDNDIAIEFVDISSELDNTFDIDSLTDYSAVLIRKGWGSPKYIHLGRKQDIDSHIKKLSSDIDRLDRQEWENHCSSLYQLIWKPLECFWNENDNIFFSPTSKLCQFCIESLEDSTHTIFNEKYSTFRVSSTKELCINKKTPSYKNAVLYGDLNYDMNPTDMEKESRAYHYTREAFRTKDLNRQTRSTLNHLPMTRIEIDSIYNNLHKNHIHTDIFTQTKGTEESFKSLSGKDVSILHLATHGFFLNKEEANDISYFNKQNRHLYAMHRSGLILSGGENVIKGIQLPQEVEDGILLSSEIALLDLSSVDLTILSACQTGLGEIENEGTFGLQRGFKKAGVNTILMSLWEVDDTATQILMTQFYKNYLSGQSKRKSLLSAQKYLREYDNGKYNNPKYWAAFIMLDGLE